MTEPDTYQEEVGRYMANAAQALAAGRTMSSSAEPFTHRQYMEEYLQQHPELRQALSQTHAEGRDERAEELPMIVRNAFMYIRNNGVWPPAPLGNLDPQQIRQLYWAVFGRTPRGINPFTLQADIVSELYERQHYGGGIGCRLCGHHIVF
jgi:hypothetical protein